MSACVPLLLLLGAAQTELPAQSSAQQIVEAVDNEAYSHDEYYKIKLRIGEGGATDPTLELFQKAVGGAFKRLIRFLDPADLRGMGILVESRDAMYVYLPGFDKVRRVGMHARTQNVMGSDFNYDDLAVTRYGPDYDATMVFSNPAEWVLDLAAKPGRDPVYVRLRASISKKCLAPSRIEFYDQHGMKVRTNVREYGPPGRSGKRCLVKSFVMTAHNRNNHTTRADVVEVRINAGIPDELFTVRSLARGN